jgi:IS5 family transposase
MPAKRHSICDAISAVLNACGYNIRKILSHIRMWLAWIVAELWTPEIPTNRRYMTPDAA